MISFRSFLPKLLRTRRHSHFARSGDASDHLGCHELDVKELKLCRGQNIIGYWTYLAFRVNVQHLHQIGDVFLHRVNDLHKHLKLVWVLLPEPFFEFDPRRVMETQIGKGGIQLLLLKKYVHSDSRDGASPLPVIFRGVPCPMVIVQGVQNQGNAAQDYPSDLHTSSGRIWALHWVTVRMCALDLMSEWRQ